MLLFSRYKPEYPPPGTYESSTGVAPLDLGTTRPPLPDLMTKGNKPVCAATIRVGHGYLEVPFFATADNHRGKGYGRCLLEAIEKVGFSLSPLLWGSSAPTRRALTRYCTVHAREIVSFLLPLEEHGCVLKRWPHTLACHSQ